MIWAGFIFGILGSFHCVGMCGPIALALPVGRGAGWSYVAGRLLYNLGRMVTYTGFGLLAGIFGQSLQLAGWQQTLSVVSGGLILVLVVAPATLAGQFRRAMGFENGLGRVRAAMTHYLGRRSTGALGMLGLLNGLLPCGFVYLALAGAISMPSVPAAMGYMFLFGLGTFPLMFVLSWSGKFIRPGFRRFFNKSVPYVASFMALLFILRGLNLGIPFVSPAIGQTKTGATQVPACHPK